MFDCEVGLSDHTMGLGVSVASVALGATMIEAFHSFRAEGGVDCFSLEPAELAGLVQETDVLGSLSVRVFGPTDAEKVAWYFAVQSMYSRYG